MTAGSTDGAAAHAAPGAWLACSTLLPKIEAPDARASGEPAGGDWSQPAQYSVRVLVTVADARQPFVSTDRIVTLEGCGEVWWERYGPLVTHWMPLPAPAPAPGSSSRAPSIPLRDADVTAGCRTPQHREAQPP